MKSIYMQSILYRFVLLATALINATVRELIYKPLLTPTLGQWAHELSSLTGILLFAIVIYFYIKKIHIQLTRKKAYFIGFLWMIMTICFEAGMGISQGKTFLELLGAYAFRNGNTWILVVLSLLFLPAIMYAILNKKTDK